LQLANNILYHYNLHYFSKKNNNMNLLLHLILELASLFALFWIFRTRQIFPAFVSAAMIISIILVLYPSIQNYFDGLYIYMTACLLAFMYGVYKLRNGNLPALIIMGSSASILLYWLWVINHWHGNTLIFPAITLIIGGVAILSRARVKNELGFLVILIADAITIILEEMLK